MKVLIVHPKVPIYGGAEKVIVRLCEYLSKKAIVHAVAMPQMPEAMKADLTKNGTPSIIGFPNILASINLYDIINFHNFPATLFSMFSNKPMVYYCNEPAELFTNWKRKFIEWGNRNLVRNRIEHVIVADKFNARRFFEIYGVVPKIIPYGIDYEFFSQSEHRPDHGWFTVLQVGTISRYKNQLATIQAIGEIKEKIPNIQLFLIGNVSEPAYKNEIEDAVRKYNLGGRVFWESHISREELRNYYEIADVVIHPVKEQGGWLTPFEAISAGVPVITSKQITCLDTVSKLAIATEDYASSLYQVYQNYEGYTQSTLKAREWVKNNLTWDKFCHSMVNYMEEIVCPKSYSVAAAPASWEHISRNSLRRKAGK